mmetsp:Transcript_19162/g.24365  ORF Transcript_19162/g.24365 Transcript_19162/m.24365 type:complete len:110 (-) Transcript_19162:174-503(-)
MNFTKIRSLCTISLLLKAAVYPRSIQTVKIDAVLYDQPKSATGSTSCQMSALRFVFPIPFIDSASGVSTRVSGLEYTEIIANCEIKIDKMVIIETKNVSDVALNLIPNR